MDKHALEAMEQELGLLRFTLDHVGAFVYTKDSEGRYTYANSMVCELFGVSLENIVGCTDEIFFDVNVADELLKNDSRVLKLGERVETEELTVVSETQEQIIFSSVKIPLRDDFGNVTGLCGISTDITKRRLLERELVEQKNLLSQVLENMDAFAYIKDSDSRYLYANENLASLLGLPVDKIIGQLERDIMPASSADEFVKMDRAVLETGQKIAGEETLNRPDGQRMHCWSIRIPLFKNGKPDRFIGISTDITEVIELKNQYLRLASIDVLTDVLTRRFFLEQAERQLKLNQRRNASMGLLFIDLDLLKEVNDAFGHEFGDTYITATVDACKRTLRTSDLIGRLGGDEFVIAIDDTDQEGIVRMADRCLKEILETTIKTPEDKRVNLSVSIGVALSTQNSTMDQLIAKADAALYEAKKAGRGRLKLASS